MGKALGIQARMTSLKRTMAPALSAGCSSSDQPRQDFRTAGDDDVSGAFLLLWSQKLHYKVENFPRARFCGEDGPVPMTC